MTTTAYTEPVVEAIDHAITEIQEANAGLAQDEERLLRARDALEPPDAPPSRAPGASDTSQARAGAGPQPPGSTPPPAPPPTNRKPSGAGTMKPSGRSLAQREANRDRIRDALRVHGDQGMSPAELRQATGLDATKLKRVIGPMVGDKILRAEGQTVDRRYHLLETATNATRAQGPAPDTAQETADAMRRAAGLDDDPDDQQGIPIGPSRRTQRALEHETHQAATDNGDPRPDTRDTIRAQIQDQLVTWDGAAKASTIADALGKSPGMIAQEIQLMIRDGIARKDTIGRYELIPAAER